jgi:hypothetical protein
MAGLEAHTCKDQLVPPLPALYRLTDFYASRSTDERPNHCYYCPKDYHTSAALTIHRQSKHKGVRSPDSLLVSFTDVVPDAAKAAGGHSTCEEVYVARSRRLCLACLIVGHHGRVCVARAVVRRSQPAQVVLHPPCSAHLTHTCGLPPPAGELGAPSRPPHRRRRTSVRSLPSVPQQPPPPVRSSVDPGAPTSWPPHRRPRPSQLSIIPMRKDVDGGRIQ